MIRITAGKWKGRGLQVPGKGTRPSHAKLRQALFNSIQLHLEGARVLDLFAGAGALGFEALSRNAASVVFVDQAKEAIRTIQNNAKSLGAEADVTILQTGVEKFLKGSHSQRFDIALIDPPYELAWENTLSAYSWTEILNPGGILCVEWGVSKQKPKELPEQLPFLVKTREKIYGDSALTHYEVTRDSSSVSGIV